jgi:hypothetical protein
MFIIRNTGLATSEDAKSGYKKFRIYGILIIFLFLIGSFADFCFAKEYHEPSTNISFDCSPQWSVEINSAEKTEETVRISCKDPYGCQIYLLAWETSPAPEGDSDYVLIMDKIMDSAAKVTETLGAKKAQWKLEPASFPGSLTFPLPMVAQGPFHDQPSNSYPYVEAWLWHGESYAYALYAYGKTYRSEDITNVLRTFSYTPFHYQATGQLNLLTWKKGWLKPARTFSVPLPSGFYEISSTKHFCRGILKSFDWDYATDGISEIFTLTYGAREDTADTTYSINEKNLVESVKKSLDCQQTKQVHWSYGKRFTRLFHYYETGQVIPVYTPAEAGNGISLTSYILGKYGIVVAVRSSDNSQLRVIQQNVEKAGFAKPSGALKTIYYFGALLSWIGAIMLIIAITRDSGFKFAIAMLIIGVVCFGIHLLTCPEMGGSWIAAFPSVTDIFYLPILTILIAIGMVLGLVGE